jgi:hypothetical protein
MAAKNQLGFPLTGSINQSDHQNDEFILTFPSKFLSFFKIVQSISSLIWKANLNISFPLQKMKDL